MTQLGNGLFGVKRHEEELSVGEAELSTVRRIGTSLEEVFRVQSNLACTYEELGRNEDALQMRRDVYSGYLKLNGEEHHNTLVAANNYAVILYALDDYSEVKSILLKVMPVTRRVLGDSNDTTLRTRWMYAKVLYKDDDATLDDLRESVTTLEELGRTVRRVLGGAHPLVPDIEDTLKQSRITLRARETPSPG